MGLLMVLGGCQSSPSIAEAGIPGAYTGTGSFSASAGTAKVKAQLELDSDGVYRLLYLEPAPLALFGVEEGTWSEEGSGIVLTPQVKEASADDGVFAKLSAASSKSAEPKSLTIEGSELAWSDAKLNLRFKRKS